MMHSDAFEIGYRIYKTKQLTLVMIKRFIAITFVSLLFWINATAQNYKPVVATPEVAALEKYGNIPVGNYTGTSEFNIPIYSLKVNNVEVPIVLSYHSSGIQVEQEATWVGLGWTLDVGGQVVQIPKGKLDQEDIYTSIHQATYQNLIADQANIDGYPEMEYAYLKQNVCYGGQNEPNNLNSIQVIKSEDIGQPDNYHFSLPGGGGEFFADPFTHALFQSGNKKAPFDIARGSNLGQYQSEWTIKDMQGNTYFFSRNDLETSNNVGSSSYYNGFTSKLTSITTPSGEAISFTYANGSYTIPTYTRSLSFDYKAGTVSEGGSGFATAFNVKYLSVVETENEKIVFVLSSAAADRLDLEAPQVLGAYGAKRLTAIEIWDKRTNRKIRSFDFSYGYFSCDLNYAGPGLVHPSYSQKRLKLQSVAETGYQADGSPYQAKPPYVFTYDETHPLPQKNSYARDHWGYFNGRANTSILPNLAPDIISGNFDFADMHGNVMPDFVVRDLQDYGNANRGMDVDYAKSGSLIQIKYPTGGISKINYEANRFKNYRIFSAAEMAGGEGHIDQNVVDLNTSGSHVLSLPVYPDANGRVLINNIAGSFTRIDQSISHTYFLNAWIRVWKVDASNTKTMVREWRVTQDAASFNQNNGSAFPRETIDMTIASTEYLQVEAYMPDISQLTPNGSSIPVAAVSCTFSARDLSTFSKESIGGGIRVSSVETSDGTNAPPIIMKYKYVLEDGITTSGKLMSPLTYYTYAKVRLAFDHSQPDADGNVRPVPPYFEDEHLASLSSQSYVPMSADAGGAVVGYSRVEVMQTSNNEENIGKTVYKYRNTPPTLGGSVNRSFRKPVPNIAYFDNGLLESAKTYNAGGTILKAEEYEYKLIESSKRRFLSMIDLVYPSIASTACYINCDAGINACQTGDALQMAAAYPYGKWLAVAYPVNTKWFVPAKVKTTMFSPGSPSLVSEIDYINYNSIGQVTREESTNSKGDLISTSYVYPIDVSSPSSLIQTMKSKNLYGLLQTTVRKKNNSVELTRQQFEYNLNSNGDINLRAVQSSRLAGALVNEVENMVFDTKNNILELSQKGSPTAFIWDHNQSLQVAEVQNADRASIAYTSFEGDGFGNWNGVSLPSVVASSTAHTGTRYLQGSFSLSKNYLPGGTYIVSYWSKNGACTVNNTSPTAVLSSPDGWTCYQHVVVNPDNSTITVSGSGPIDELRLHPKAAMMKTITYLPMIGPDSITDQSNRTVYYEYDGYGRLALVRDQNRNVIKKYCYLYSGQAGSCQ